jgi:beta-lactamase regulating signal transducer with metallopeptidase domain
VIPLASKFDAVVALALLLKITVILTGGLVIAALTRRRSAALRHGVWLLALASSLALAVLTPMVPRLSLPVALPAGLEVPNRAAIGQVPSPGAVPEGRVAGPENQARVTADDSGVTSNRRSPPSASPSAAPLGEVWLVGFLAVLLWCLLGHVGLARLARRATPVEGEMGEEGARGSAWPAGWAPQVRIAWSSSVGTPLTWGWLRPIILLPREAQSWPAERRRIAVLHELGHVTRRDYLAQLVATLTCAVYWFHPLVWIAAARLRSESEHACDDCVLAQGAPPVDYAAALLEVARRAGPLRRTGTWAIGMARPSHLEGRLLAVLDDSRARAAVPRRVAAPIVAIVGLLLGPLAGLLPGPVPGAADEPPRARRQSLSSEDGPASTFERTIQTSPGGRLRLDLETGANVEVRGWDAASVQVRARLEGPDWRDTRIEVAREGSGVKVYSTQTDRASSYSTSHALEIRVPRRYDIELSSSGGSLTIVGIEGTFRGHTGGGEIVLEHDEGLARLTTGGGDVRVSDSRLDGSVSTGGGMVRISNVRGDLNGSSGSGPVIRSDGSGEEGAGSGYLRGVTVDKARRRIGLTGKATTGVLSIDKAGGDVDLEDAPEGARVTTGGGDIRIGRGAGTVEASTGGGDLEIGPIAGSVSAGTGAGTVHVTLADGGGRPQTVEITSGSGPVVIELPEDFDGRFELETAYTRSYGRAARIESAWSLDHEPTTPWDASHGTPRRYVRAHGVSGDGRGRVRVRTVNGDIEVRQASGKAR